MTSINYFVGGANPEEFRSVAITITVCGNEILTAPNPFDVPVLVLQQNFNEFYEIFMTRFQAMFVLTHPPLVTSTDCKITWYEFYKDSTCTTLFSHPAIGRGTAFQLGYRIRVE